MIEKTEVDGRPATVAYLSKDWEPADRDNWYLAKVIFDDGQVVFLTNEERSNGTDSTPGESEASE